jgi:multimeric flavodoxin WrbA
MKVVLFNGSPRKDGNTRVLLEAVAGPLDQAGIATEIVQVGGNRIAGCKACRVCAEKRDRKCAVDDDPVNGWMTKAFEADGIVIGSPTYFTDVTAETKAFIDRMGLVSGANGGLLARKAGAAVVAVRRGGGTHAFDTINHLFQISRMFIVGSTYWNLGFGHKKGDVLGDEEGMRNMRNLGENMAFLLGRLAGPEQPAQP